MNFDSSMFSEPWLILSWCLLLVAALFVVRYFPFRAVLSVPLHQHLILGSSVGLFALWTLGIGLKGQAFELHLFGVTATLMLLGLSPALLAGALALVWFSVSGQAQWSAFAVNFLLAVVLPMLISFAVLECIRRLPQKNLFVFMLGGGFLGAIIARMLCTALVYAMFSLSDDAALAEIAQMYLPWMLLIAFPEGFINGFIISAISVFYPQWVRGLDERRYIDQR